MICTGTTVELRTGWSPLPQLHSVHLGCPGSILFGHASGLVLGGQRDSTPVGQRALWSSFAYRTLARHFHGTKHSHTY